MLTGHSRIKREREKTEPLLCKKIKSLPDRQNIFDDAFKNSKNYQKSQMNAVPTECINAKRIKKKANSNQHRSFIGGL